MWSSKKDADKSSTEETAASRLADYTHLSQKIQLHTVSPLYSMPSQSQTSSSDLARVLASCLYYNAKNMPIVVVCRIKLLFNHQHECSAIHNLDVYRG